MSMRTIARSSSNRKSASALASSVLPTPVGPRNRNEPVGRLGSATPARVRRTASDTAATALRLPDDALAQFVFHPQQLGGLALEHPPAGMPVHADTTSAMSSGPTSSLSMTSSCASGGRQRGVELLLDLRDAPVAQLGGLGQVTVALGALGLAAQRLQLLLELADDVDGVLLVLPAGGQLGQLLLVVGQLGTQLLQPLLRRVVLLLGQRHLLDLEPTHQALDLVDLDGPGVDLHPQPAGGLVDQVDGLVRQEAAVM